MLPLLANFRLFTVFYSPGHLQLGASITSGTHVAWC